MRAGPKHVGRRQFLALAGGAIASPLVAKYAGAQGAEITLRLHHFLPPSSNGQVRFLAPWAEKVQQDSGGRIRIQIFPAMQLGGTPPQLFDQARDGVADIVWTLPGNTPGRFPRIEVFELPFVAHRRAATNSRALWAFAQEHLREEFREVHPITFWAHDHGLIHANRPVNTLDDMRGLRLRFATRQTGEMLRALGAQAVGMPAPQVSEALSQRAIDGTIFPWEVIPSLRVHEMVRNHTEIPGSPTLYTATFILAMSRSRYEALSPQAKQALDANSGEVAATMAGNAWDAASQASMEQVRARGNTLISLSESEVRRWREATAPVTEAWVRQMRERNIDGERLLADARSTLGRFAAS